MTKPFWMTDPYPLAHPLDQHVWIAKRQKELEAQYIREERFKLTPAEEKLLARGIAAARRRAQVDYLQRKYDDEIKRGSAR